LASIELKVVKRTEPELLKRMAVHYSKPKGFVGRNICYAVYFDDVYYGNIVGGSSTRFLKGRNEFLGVTIKDLNRIVNNIFYNISKVGGKYPCRNFTTAVLKQFVKQISIDWENKYGDKVVGFETLIEKPRTGDLYLKAGWVLVGETIGYTCKRVSGKSTDNWTGKRVWNTDKDKLRPKIVLCYKAK
jgi:hypothetical protein